MRGRNERLGWQVAWKVGLPLALGALLLVAGRWAGGEHPSGGFAHAALVARSGILEQVWEAEFHLGWPDGGQAPAQLTATIPVARLQRLHVGDTITLRLATRAGDHDVLAKVVEVSAPVDGVAQAVFRTAEAHRLTGLHGRIPGRIIVTPGQFGTIVPVAALHRRSDGEGVYVQRQQGPAWVPVRVIARNLTEALVEGVAPGTQLLDEEGINNQNVEFRHRR